MSFVCFSNSTYEQSLFFGFRKEGETCEHSVKCLLSTRERFMRPIKYLKKETYACFDKEGNAGCKMNFRDRLCFIRQS